MTSDLGFQENSFEDEIAAFRQRPARRGARSRPFSSTSLASRLPCAYPHDTDASKACDYWLDAVLGDP